MLTQFKKSAREPVPLKARGFRWYLNLAAFFCVVSYVVFQPALFYKAFEFLPSKRIAKMYAWADCMKHDDVYISLLNGKKIHAWYFESPNAPFTVIVHHGQSCNVANYLNTVVFFHNIGTNVLIYDYEGFGLSDGPTDHMALRRDAEAAYWYVRRNKSIPAEQIVHCGVSLGTGAASDIASRQPCAGAFLCSAYWRESDVARHVVPVLRMYPDAAFPQPDFGAVELVKTKVPIFIVHGEKDPLMPKQGVERIYNQALEPKQLMIIPNERHIGGPAVGSEDTVIRWLGSLSSNNRR